MNVEGRSTTGCTMKANGSYWILQIEIPLKSGPTPAIGGAFRCC